MPGHPKGRVDYAAIVLDDEAIATRRQPDQEERAVDICLEYQRAIGAVDIRFHPGDPCPLFAGKSQAEIVETGDVAHVDGLGRICAATEVGNAIGIRGRSIRMAFCGIARCWRLLTRHILSLERGAGADADGHLLFRRDAACTSHVAVMADPCHLLRISCRQWDRGG